MSMVFILGIRLVKPFDRFDRTCYKSLSYGRFRLMRKKLPVAPPPPTVKSINYSVINVRRYLCTVDIYCYTRVLYVLRAVKYTVDCSGMVNGRGCYK